MSDLDILRGRLIQMAAAEAETDSWIYEQLSLLGDDGAWSDVDYDDPSRTQWKPSGHTRRLAVVARSYRKADSRFFEDRTFKDRIVAALDYWTNRGPESDNWWWNIIDTPRQLAAVLLLLGDDAPEKTLRACEEIVRRSGYTRSGTNLTWEAGNLMTLALTIDDEDLLAESIAHITSVIQVTTDTGIQPDYSYHQHGPQMYMSNYGEAFADDMSRYGELFAGTSFALDRAQVRALAGLVLDGQQWFMRGAQLDYHALGRQIATTRAGKRGKTFVDVCERMMSVDPDRADEYKAFGSRVAGFTPAGSSGPIGNKHFWRSDAMIQRSSQFVATLRMHSTRTGMTEVRVNRENLKGFHLSDGCMFVLRRGTEYVGIPPVWNWRQLPGTTSRDTDEPFPYGRDVDPMGRTDFVGGCSNGKVGVAVYDQDKDGVRAKKTYAMFDGGIVCLGAGIESDSDDPVSTSIAQEFLRGPVTSVDSSGSEHVEGSCAGEITRITHDDTTYAVLESAEVTVRAEKQCGTWTSIEQNNADTSTIEHDVFRVCVEHGSRPSDASYAYAILPGTSDSNPSGPAHVLRNDSTVQAVRFPDGTVTAVIREAGNAEFGSTSVAVDKPCALVIGSEDANPAVHIADPTQKLSSLELNLELAGWNGSTRVELPGGPHSGESVRVVW